jgi:flagellar basal-body rod modification protein FlgD
MQVNSATSTTTAPAASTAASSSSSGLSETQFLQLLTEQLENQDPLQPEDDTQFLAQMAQFTSLQETDTLNQQVERLTAAGYIGATVTVNPGNTSPVTGQVTGVDTSSTDPQLIVNGAEYPLSELSFVTSAPAASATAASLHALPRTSASASTTQTPVAAGISAAKGKVSITAALKS